MEDARGRSFDELGIMQDALRYLDQAEKIKTLETQLAILKSTTQDPPDAKLPQPALTPIPKNRSERRAAARKKKGYNEMPKTEFQRRFV